MTSEQAHEIITILERKHKLFRAISITPHRDGFFVEFEQIDLDPRSIYKWFEAAGVYPLYMGSQGTGDNRVMVAEIRV